MVLAVLRFQHPNQIKMCEEQPEASSELVEFGERKLIRPSLDRGAPYRCIYIAVHIIRECDRRLA
jgi:hypothetical protein